MKQFLKKQSTGFFFSIVTIIVALIALLVYVKNGFNPYYNDFNSKIVILTIVAIVAEIIFIVLVETIGEKRWLDIMYLIPPILLGISAVAFISIRVESAGIILGSELEKGNALASNALLQAFIGIGLYLVAMITSFIKSFHSQLKH
jgi:hypothetical protein